MPEDLYPRPISLTHFPVFQASHLYALGAVVRPTTPNDHVYIVTAGGTSAGEPSWPTTSQATAVTGGVTFTENGESPGVQYLKYLKHAKDWGEITLISTYEDKGVDTNESAADAPQRWTLEYNGLDQETIAELDEFWDDHRLSVSFTFVEPREEPWDPTDPLQGDTVAGVYFESYERPDHDKVWVQQRIVHLIKYPA